MTSSYEFFKLVLLVGLAGWLALLGRQLWYYYRFRPRKVLALLLKNQEDLVEGLVHHLVDNWEKVEQGQWEIVLVDLGSQDQTRKILGRIIRGKKLNINFFFVNQREKQEFLQELLHKHSNKHILVLTLTGKAGGKEVCRTIDNILASNINHAITGDKRSTSTL